MEQRAWSTLLRQRTLFAAVFSAVFQLVFAFFSSSSVDLIQVLAGLPLFLLPCGFHFKVCLVVSVNGVIDIDYFMVGERVRFLFTSCEESCVL